MHDVQNAIAALAAAGRVDIGRIGVGAFNQTRQGGGLGNGDVPGRFAEIKPAGLADAVDGHRSILPEIDFVEVHFQNGRLVVTPLDDQGQKHLFPLARQGPVRRQKKILGQLLGDGRSALANAAGTQIGEKSPADAAPVESKMLEKTAVFRRQNSTRQPRRKLIDGDQFPFFSFRAEEKPELFRFQGHQRQGRAGRYAG